VPNATELSNAELASSLRLALMRAARRIRSQRIHTEITLSQLSALATVKKHAPMSAGEVAAIERVQPPSMTRILASLESAGWIERSPHAVDRRQSVITATQAGLDLLDDETRARDEWLARRLLDLSAADRERLRKSIDVLDRLGSE
jgi:DNA-binding MarR family transcriptional regulator